MKTLKSYKWMCPEPFTSVSTSTSGQFRPCCVVPNTMETLSNHFPEGIHTVDNSDFKSFYHSDFMKRLRDAMRNDTDEEFVSEVCKVCIEQERANSMSHREWYILKFDKDFRHRKQELETIIENDTDPSFFHIIQLNSIIGNYCNLSCSMCHESASSTLLDEKLKLNERITIPIRIVNNKPSPLIKPKNSSKFKKEIPELISMADELKLVGGEPLLSKDVYALLSDIQNPEKHIINIITNATIDPTKFINLTQKFKKIRVDISIEGIGKVNDYIRHPSKWETIISNYSKFLGRKQYITTFVSTVNALNVAYLPKICEILPEHKYSFNSFVIDNPYSLESIPDDIKQQFLLKLNQYSKYKKVAPLVNHLNNVQFNESQMIEMIKSIKRRDQLRGTNLLEVFPEWEYYYNSIQP